MRGLGKLQIHKHGSVVTVWPVRFDSSPMAVSDWLINYAVFEVRNTRSYKKLCLWLCEAQPVECVAPKFIAGPFVAYLSQLQAGRIPPMTPELRIKVTQNVRQVSV